VVTGDTIRAMCHHRIMVAPEVYRVTVGPKGRVVIPAALRRELGINEGDTVSMTAVDGILEVATPAGAMQRIRAMFAEKVPPGVDLVQELFDERRREFERELREMEEVERTPQRERKSGT